MSLLGRYGRNSPLPVAGAGAGGAVAPEPVPLGANSLVVVEVTGAEAGRARVALFVSWPTRPVTRSCSGCGCFFAADRVGVGLAVRMAVGAGDGLTRAATAV